MAERKSMMLYYDAISQWDMMTDEQAGALIKALLRYGKTGERLETDDGMVAMAFSFMAAQIDRDGEKWDRTCEKRRAAVNKRWAMQKHTSDTNVYTCIQTHTNDTDTVTDTDTVINNNIESSAKTGEKRKRFTPPTVEEVKAYCEERGNNVDPQRFVDFYEMKDWMVGRNKMKDWKAAVRTWEKRDGDRGGTQGGVNGGNQWAGYWDSEVI